METRGTFPQVLGARNIPSELTLEKKRPNHTVDPTKQILVRSIYPAHYMQSCLPDQ